MANYTVKLKPPKGHVAPPLLADLGRWLGSQPYGSAGYFDLVASAVPGSWSGADWKRLQRDAWCFLSLPEGSLLALLDAVTPAPVVLFPSESDRIKLVAPSLEAFLLAVGAGKTKLDELDDAQDLAPLAAWLKAKQVRPSKPAKFDLAAYVRSAAPVPLEGDVIKKFPPVPRLMANLIGRPVTDAALAGDLKKLGVRGKSPTRPGKLVDKSSGITITFARAGKDLVVKEVHLGEKYKGDLPFKLPVSANNFTVKKLLGKPTGELKQKHGGPIWEKLIDKQRKLYFARSRGHFAWWSEHRFYAR